MLDGSKSRPTKPGVTCSSHVGCTDFADIQARFWSRVDKAGDCWLWTGTRTKAGYGIFHVGKTTIGAHRLSVEIATGLAVPTGLYACHKCDNPPCVNPDHLFVGDALANSRDMVAKGRRRGRDLLTKATIARLRAEASEGIPRGWEFAESQKLGCCEGVISRVVRGHVVRLKGPLDEISKGHGYWKRKLAIKAALEVNQ